MCAENVEEAASIIFDFVSREDAYAHLPFRLHLTFPSTSALTSTLTLTLPPHLTPPPPTSYDDDDLASDGGMDAVDPSEGLLEHLAKPLPADTE